MFKALLRNSMKLRQEVMSCATTQLITLVLWRSLVTQQLTKNSTAKY